MIYVIIFGVFSIIPIFWLVAEIKKLNIIVRLLLGILSFLIIAFIAYNFGLAENALDPHEPRDIDLNIAKSLKIAAEKLTNNEDKKPIIYGLSELSKVMYGCPHQYKYSTKQIREYFESDFEASEYSFKEYLDETMHLYNDDVLDGDLE